MLNTSFASARHHGRAIQNQPAVLIIENDGLTGNVLQYLVEQCAPQIQTFSAQCLRDAIGLIESVRFSLVIADLGLPDSRGLNTAAEIRLRTNTPILLYSAALNDPHLVNEATEAGFFYCLAKGGSTRQQVGATIRQLLAEQH
ncbi:MAG: response regulator [Burkholderiaceae bacterium]